MLDNIKYQISLKSVDGDIAVKRYDLALEKLNNLITAQFRPSQTYLKRGRLCKKLLMFDEAYADFTYIITNCAEKKDAYYERVRLNFELSNYFEAIHDSKKILSWDEDNTDVKKIKILSLIYTKQDKLAVTELMELFDHDKYLMIGFLLNETATMLSKNEFAKGLRLSDVINIIDNDNPIMLLNKSNIYAAAGEEDKQQEFINYLYATFPSYFVSHFRYFDMYQDKNLAEICFLLELEAFDRNKMFAYPFAILKGYKLYLEGHIIDSKDAFKEAIAICPHKPEGYVLLGQTLQLLSGYDSPEYRKEAEESYRKALEIYTKENLLDKAEEMKTQIKHLNSTLTLI